MPVVQEQLFPEVVDLVAAPKEKPRAWFPLAILAVVTGWIAVGLYVIDATVPAHPARTPGRAAVAIRSLLPQGWGFFTKSPRTARWLVYGERDGQWVRVDKGPHSRPANLFGLNRLSKRQGIEFQRLLSQVRSQVEWRHCQEPIGNCIPTLSIEDEVAPLVAHPTLCGDLALVIQRPAPWSWVNGGLETRPTAHVWRVMVRC